MLSGWYSRLKQSTPKLIQNLSQNYTTIKSRISSTSQFKILQIMPNLYHISYPQSSTLPLLHKHISTSQFQIWNISQYHYPLQLQDKILQKSSQGQIHHLCYEYYANLPLYELIIAVNSIWYFMGISQENKVYLHCQDNKIRSAVFLVCFLYKFKMMGVQEISQAIHIVNKVLNVAIEGEKVEDKGETVHYNNFHTFFKNYINYLHSPSLLNPYKLQLLKIIISQAPTIKLPQQTLTSLSKLKQLSVLIQIRCKQQLIMKGTYNNNILQGDSMCIELRNKSVILSDDFLVVVKYHYQGKMYNMMRIQLNTNFVHHKFVRVHQQQIDLSAHCGIVNKENPMFIDFMFEENQEKSDLAKLEEIPHQQTLKISKKHQIKEDQNKEKKQVQTTVETSEENFSLNQHEEEEQVDQHEINRKIEEVLQNMKNKETARKQEEEKEKAQQKEQQAQEERNREVVQAVAEQKEQEKIEQKQSEKAAVEEQPIKVVKTEPIKEDKSKEQPPKAQSSQSQQQQQDLDDYLSKLQAQAQ